MAKSFENVWRYKAPAEGEARRIETIEGYHNVINDKDVFYIEEIYSSVKNLVLSVKHKRPVNDNNERMVEQMTFTSVGGQRPYNFVKFDKKTFLRYLDIENGNVLVTFVIEVSNLSDDIDLHDLERDIARIENENGSAIKLAWNCPNILGHASRVE